MKEVSVIDCSVEKIEELTSMLIKKHGKRKGQIFADTAKCIDTEDLFI